MTEDRSLIESMAEALVNRLAAGSSLPGWDCRNDLNRQIWIDAIVAAVKALPDVADVTEYAPGKPIHFHFETAKNALLMQHSHVTGDVVTFINEESAT